MSGGLFLIEPILHGILIKGHHRRSSRWYRSDFYLESISICHHTCTTVIILISSISLSPFLRHYSLSIYLPTSLPYQWHHSYLRWSTTSIVSIIISNPFIFTHHHSYQTPLASVFVIPEPPLPYLLFKIHHQCLHTLVFFISVPPLKSPPLQCLGLNLWFSTALWP